MSVHVLNWDRYLVPRTRFSRVPTGPDRGARRARAERMCYLGIQKHLCWPLGYSGMGVWGATPEPEECILALCISSSETIAGPLIIWTKPNKPTRATLFLPCCIARGVVQSVPPPTPCPHSLGYAPGVWGLGLCVRGFDTFCSQEPKVCAPTYHPHHPYPYPPFEWPHQPQHLCHPYHPNNPCPPYCSTVTPFTPHASTKLVPKVCVGPNGGQNTKISPMSAKIAVGRGEHLGYDDCRMVFPGF